jgi:hypothetical protein
MPFRKHVMWRQAKFKLRHVCTGHAKTSYIVICLLGGLRPYIIRTSQHVNHRTLRADRGLYKNVTLLDVLERTNLPNFLALFHSKLVALVNYSKPHSLVSIGTLLTMVK